MIITEKEKSLAVFSSLLFRHYPELKEQLHGVMRSYHKAVGMADKKFSLDKSSPEVRLCLSLCLLQSQL